MLFGLSVAGCARQGAVSAESPAEVLRRDPSRLIEEVATVRGLADVKPTKIVFDDDATFARALDVKAGKDAIGPTASDTIGFFAAFEFPGTNAKHGASPDEVISEQVIAFYDVWTHSIHVRTSAVEKDADNTLMVVAHEITHSLQTQHLPDLDLAAITDKDTRLAQLAVLEGDAMLSMIAHAAWRHRVPVKRALARAAVAVAEEAFAKYAEASGRNRALLHAPPLVRERLTFPYERGLTFIGDLYRAGGFALVNRVYATPPTTTEHVLHPEKYLAGEQAVPVNAPAPPAGYELLVNGRVGELQIRVVLEQCVPHAQAAEAAAGWGGDAYAIVGKEPNAALLWSTVWDSAQEAEEFERALRAYVACTRERSGTHIMPLDDSVKREGDKVALVRGLSKQAASAELAELLDLPRPKLEARAPFGKVEIPALKHARAFRQPYVANGAYVNEQLGLVSAVPWGFRVDMVSATSVVFARESPSPAVGGIALSDQIASNVTIDELHGTLAATVQKLLGKYDLVYVGGQDVFLPQLGRGIDRYWQVERSTAGLRAIVVPVCNGTGSFLFWELWVDGDGENALRQWLGTVRPTAWQEPPMCAELDP
jgi:hypothetical protein